VKRFGEYAREKVQTSGPAPTSRCSQTFIGSGDLTRIVSADAQISPAMASISPPPQHFVMTFQHVSYI
jgi:hypothetical protein